VSDLVHQFVEDGLEVDGFVIFILWKRGGKENEWSEVESVPIELTLLPHADTMHQTEIFPFLHEISQFVLGERYRDTRLHGTSIDQSDVAM